MALSLNQAQNIVQKLSNDQLMQAYTDGSVPQFIVFSEMQRRQQMANSQAKMPTETVAEKMVGRESEPEGIASMEPQFAAKGGITKSSPLTMGYSEELPSEARKIISMRLQQMKDLEEPDYNPPQYAAEGDLIESQAPEPSQGSPVSSRDIARMIMPSLINVESGGRQSAVSNKGATGVAQLMPTTAPEAAKMAGVPWDYNRYKNDPTYNATLGHAYLTSMLDRFGDREKALAAYNAGPGRVAGAIQKAQSTGGDWRSYLPRETQAYIGKVLGGAQRNLPERQTPEGADLRDERAVGYDPAFGGGRDITPPPYQYDRRSPLLDPSRMPSTSSIDKGLAALRAAQSIQGARFSEGGAVYLAGGNDGKELRDREAQNKIRQFAQIQQAITGKQEPIYNINPPEPTDYPIGSGELEVDESPIPQTAREALKNRDRVHNRFDFLTPEQTEYYDRVSRLDSSSLSDQPQGTGMESFVTPEMMEGRSNAPGIGELIGIPPSPFSVWKKEGINLPRSDKVAPPEAEGIASGLPIGMGIPSVAPRGTTPPGGPKPPGTDKGVDGAGGAGAGGTGEDQSFNQVLKQVKDAIGINVPDEMKKQMAEHQDTLKQMRNDKVVDTLFAAAKTLAGQRKGSVNFADAVANAGLAAQEAQKRIYKAEDDMRKYRMEAIKLEQEGNKTAATQAMNYVIAANHDKKALQTAIMQTNRMIQSQEASERRTNIASSTRELVAAESKLADLNRMILNPNAFGITDTKSLEIERSRLQDQIAGARAGLNYWQHGTDYNAVKEEMKRRGLI